MATTTATATADADDGGECSSYSPPPACDGSHSDCSVSGVELLELKEGGRIIGECSEQAPRAASKGKGRILRRPRAFSEPRAASTSACSSSSSLNGRRRRRSRRREVERRGVGVGHRDRGDHCVEPLALPLGMSIAAVIAQVSSIAKSSFSLFRGLLSFSSLHCSYLCALKLSRCLTNVIFEWAA